MTRSPVSNFFTALVTWGPILLVIGGAVWFLALGAMHLEMITYGSEVFVGNHETANVPSWKLNQGGSTDMQAQSLLEALNSGDTARMQSALSHYEATSAAAEAGSAGGAAAANG